MLTVDVLPGVAQVHHTYRLILKHRTKGQTLLSARLDPVLRRVLIVCEREVTINV